MQRVAFCLAIVLAFLGPAAYATGGESGEWEIGPYLGYGFLDDYRTLSPEDDFLLGIRAGYFFTRMWSLEGSYQRLSSETQFNPLLGFVDRDFDIDSLRLNVLYNFHPRETFRPFVAVGFGVESIDVDSVVDRNDLGINLGGGARWYRGEHFGFRVDGRYVLTDVGGSVDDSQSNIEVTAGVLWTFGGKRAHDKDRDGIPDSADDCPSTRRGAAVDSHGCPSDSDGDGVPDGIDRCLDTRRALAVDARGCAIDSDRDGVNDADDQCPATPRGALVESAGCPRDTDRDGVFDGIDRCPDTPVGAKTNASGCPSDRDEDGVLDGIDRCPESPRDAVVDASGCSEPQPQAPIPTREQPLILEGVRFHSNEATLTRQSLAVLDRVAASLRNSPEVRVEIGGHTDSTGSSDGNLRLSTARAMAVRDYLDSQGVAASRLTVRGYGEGQPIADDESSEGRARNRRVELIRID